MSNPILTSSFVAEAAINKYRIVKHGAADGGVVPAGAVNDAMFGVATEIDAAIGQRVDVIIVGEALIESGSVITRGMALTADFFGRATPAVPAAGVNNRIIGFALASATVGDIIPMLLSPGYIQG